MFKFIRKWYFKLYHLFRFLGIIVLIFGIQKNVYAEEYNTCFDEYKVGTYTFTYQSTYWVSLNEYIPVEPNTTYFIKFFSTTNFTGSRNNFFSSDLNAFNKNKEAISGCYFSTNNLNYNEQTYSFKTCNIENVAFIKPNIYTFSNNYTVLENTPIVISTNLEDLLTCPPEPPAPENNVYSNFLTLYTDRLNYLAGESANNPYLKAMIGIIFAWVVLELFLKILHLRGGYHK